MLFLHYIPNTTNTYCTLRVIANAGDDTAGNLWDTSNENCNDSFDGNSDSFDIPFAEDTGSGFYSASIPSNLPAGTYVQSNYKQEGGSPDIPNDYFISSEIVNINSSGERQESWTPSDPGYTTHTLTIRTTGDSPIGSGVKVWVNSSNTKSGTITPTKYTDSSGQVTFDLDDGIYYVFCSSDDYTFNEGGTKNKIDSSGGTYSFDVYSATAVSTPDTGTYTSAFLDRMITSIRRYADEPSTNHKYSDDELVDEISKAYPLIIGEKNRNQRDTHIVATTTITVVSGTEKYILPPVIGKIMGIYNIDSTYGTKTFYFSRGAHACNGRGVWTSGNVLNIQPNHITAGTVITIEYIPSYTASLHNGKCTLNADGDVATLSNAPHLGSVDTEVQAYAGCVLRILSADNEDYVQERTITSYDRTSKAATLEKALSPKPSGNIVYEICPPIHKGLDDVVAARVARDILLTEGSQKRAKSVQSILADRMRHLRLSAYYQNIPEAARASNRHYHNTRRGMRRVP